MLAKNENARIYYTLKDMGNRQAFRPEGAHPSASFAEGINVRGPRGVQTPSWP